MPPPLSELLHESVDEVRQREATALDHVLDRTERRVVLFGSGTLGKRALKLLNELGAQVMAFSDNNPESWGTKIEGIPVLSPEQVGAQFGDNATVFVTIWNDHHWYSQTHERLTVVGCQFISTYAPIFWRFPETFLTLFLLNEPPHRLYEDCEHVLKAEQLWADQESLDCYRANIAWRAVGDALELPGPPEVFTYFPKDIFAFGDEDSLLDCGAFDGDTLREIFAFLPNGPQAVYAVEADAVSFANLKAYVASLPPEVAEKIHPMQCAIGEERCKLRFECSGSLTSTVSNEGVEVDCLPIDEAFADKTLTMIKMDIEGAEYGALRGGRAIIERDLPILAICVYHTQNDIWRIPLLLREYLPEHKFFLRAYEGDGFQTVLFAVPASRVTA